MVLTLKITTKSIHMTTYLVHQHTKLVKKKKKKKKKSAVVQRTYIGKDQAGQTLDSNLHCDLALEDNPNRDNNFFFFFFLDDLTLTATMIL